MTESEIIEFVDPGPRTADLARTLLAEAHERAVARHERRTARRPAERSRPTHTYVR